jgi:hypothetical protein
MTAARPERRLDTDTQTRSLPENILPEWRRLGKASIQLSPFAAEFVHPVSPDFSEDRSVVLRKRQLPKWVMAARLLSLVMWCRLGHYPRPRAQFSVYR